MVMSSGRDNLEFKLEKLAHSTSSEGWIRSGTDVQDEGSKEKITVPNTVSIIAASSYVWAFNNIIVF